MTIIITVRMLALKKKILKDIKKGKFFHGGLMSGLYTLFIRKVSSVDK